MKEVMFSAIDEYIALQPERAGDLSFKKGDEKGSLQKRWLMFCGF